MKNKTKSIPRVVTFLFLFRFKLYVKIIGDSYFPVANKFNNKIFLI